MTEEAESGRNGWLGPSRKYVKFFWQQRAVGHFKTMILSWVVTQKWVHWLSLSAERAELLTETHFRTLSSVTMGSAVNHSRHPFMVDLFGFCESCQQASSKAYCLPWNIHVLSHSRHSALQDDRLWGPDPSWLLAPSDELEELRATDRHQQHYLLYQILFSHQLIAAFS